MSAIAIVHPSGLLGKELAETLENRAKQWREIRLLSTLEDEVGGLTNVAGGAALVTRYEPESLNKASTVYFCGPIDADRPCSATSRPMRSRWSSAGRDARGRRAGGGRRQPRGGAPRPHLAVAAPGGGAASHSHPLRDLGPGGRGHRRPARRGVRHPRLEELFRADAEIVMMTRVARSPSSAHQLAFNMMPANADSGRCPRCCARSSATCRRSPPGRQGVSSTASR